MQDAPYFKAGFEYVVPASSFFFAPHPPRSNVIDFLPSKIAADRLMTQYWNAVHCLARIVHRPSFERQYDYFWQSFASGFEPPPSQQAAVFAAMFSSAMSMSDDAVMQDFGVSKPSLVDTLRMGTETALSKANFLKTTKLETLQALVMYLVSPPFTETFPCKARTNHPRASLLRHELTPCFWCDLLLTVLIATLEPPFGICLSADICKSCLKVHASGTHTPTSCPNPSLKSSTD